MSATPSAGALRAACNLYGRTDSLYMSERQCALVIHDAIHAETAALVAEIKEAWTIVNILHMEQMDQKEVWPRALLWLEKNEALAKHGEGAE